MLLGALTSLASAVSARATRKLYLRNGNPSGHRLALGSSAGVRTVRLHLAPAPRLQDGDEDGE